MEHVKEAFRSSVHYILNTPLKFSMENMKPKHVSPEEEIPVAEIIIFRSQWIVECRVLLKIPNHRVYTHVWYFKLDWTFTMIYII